MPKGWHGSLGSSPRGADEGRTVSKLPTLCTNGPGGYQGTGIAATRPRFGVCYRGYSDPFCQNRGGGCSAQGRPSCVDATGGAATLPPRPLPGTRAP